MRRAADFMPASTSPSFLIVAPGFVLAASSAAWMLAELSALPAPSSHVTRTCSRPLRACQ